MARSLRVQQACIGTVKLAVKRNGFLNQRVLAEDIGLARSTVSNFLTGKPVDRVVFEEICDRLSLNWQDIADLSWQDASNELQTTQQFDWGDAPDVALFYGRSEVLSELEQWITQTQCRLTLILGMGGVGKTALSVKLAERICDRFEAVIWRSLRNAPPLNQLLSDLILALSQQQLTSLPESPKAQQLEVLEYLRQRRCLLVLDNAESILKSAELGGLYREGYEDYDEFFCVIADGRHQSALLLTSREKPRSLAIRESDSRSVRSLQLSGLPTTDGQQILSACGLVAEERDFDRLIESYTGNPLALKISAATIRSTFGGNVPAFLQQGIAAYGGIWELLDQQFERLSLIERQVMVWLAIEREPISFEALQTNWIPPISQRSLLEALESLRGRSLIETSSSGLTQQPVVMEFVTQTLLNQIEHELINQTLEGLRQYALLKAQTKDYIRAIQTRLILQPLVEKLLITLHDEASVKFLLNQLLNVFRGKPLSYTGYAVGNLINLLSILCSDLNDADFSDLAITQADFTQTTLHRADFTNATIHRSSFAETFGGIVDLALSPSGQQLAASDSRCNIHLWDLAETKKRMTLRGHRSWICSMQFSPSGQSLATASDDYTVKLWDLETGACLQTLKGPANLPHSMTFSTDERSLIYSDDSITFWNVEHPEQQIIAMQGYPYLAKTIAFSPDGQTIAITTQEETIKLWNRRTGECEHTFDQGTDRVRYLAFNPTGTLLASTSLNQTIQLWEISAKRLRATLHGHIQGISKIVFSPDGQLLASSSFDRTIKIWDITTGDCLKTLLGHQKHLMSVAFTPDGQRVVSGGEDHAVKLWDIQTGQCLTSIQGYTNAVMSISVCATESILASAQEDQSIRLWNLKTNQVIQTLLGHTDLVWSVAFSPQNPAILASASSDRTVKLWNWQTGDCLHTFPHANWVRSVAFDLTGQILASGCYDQSVTLRSVETGEIIHQLRGHDNAVSYVIFSPDGKRLASSSYDRTIRIWDVQTGTCLQTFQGHRDRIWQVVFSADGKMLASCGDDQTIKLWDCQTGDCLRNFVGHQGTVTSICFDPASSQLVSGGFDQTLRLWDIVTGECLSTLNTRAGGVLFVQQVSHLFSANREVESEHSSPLHLSSNLDGTIQLWALQSKTCLTSLQVPRPYEAMKMTNLEGVTEAQVATLKALGADDQ